MKVSAEQEPKIPSLRHMLEGEKRPNRAKPRKPNVVNEPRKAAKSHAKPCKPNVVNEPRKAAKKARSRMDVNEAEGSETECWTPHT